MRWSFTGFAGKLPSSSVFISVRGALVLRIAYGCPKYKSLTIFHLFCEVPQMKNCLFPIKPLPLCKQLRFVQFGQEVAEKYGTIGFDMLRAADESLSSEQCCPALCFNVIIESQKFQKIGPINESDYTARI